MTILYETIFLKKELWYNIHVRENKWFKSTLDPKKSTRGEKYKDMREKIKGLNRDLIKCIAMLTMLLNHIAHTLLEAETLLYDIFIGVGYFTAITMCYFLVEGYEYTRSKKKYALRLLVFALLTQVQYTLAFGYLMFNMLFTLLFCFLILYVMDNMRGKWYKIPLVVLLFILTVFSDWALMAPTFTLLFRWSKKDRKKLVLSYGISVLMFILMIWPNYLFDVPAGQALLHAVLDSLSLVASGMTIMFLYNGKKSQSAKGFFKWFFYIFYPGHILVLYLLMLLLK